MKNARPREWIKPPPSRRPKQWDAIEKTVGLPERNRYGLQAGQLWGRRLEEVLLKHYFGEKRYQRGGILRKEFDLEEPTPFVDSTVAPSEKQNSKARATHHTTSCLSGSGRMAETRKTFNSSSLMSFQDKIGAGEDSCTRHSHEGPQWHRTTQHHGARPTRRLCSREYDA